jgi:molybdate/tungstate transport system substrate-binding protein
MELHTSVSADESPSTRRQFLRGAAAAGLLGTTGCLGGAGVAGPGRGQRAGAEPVRILAAGSLQHALASAFVNEVTVPVAVECHGSATLARLVAEGHRDPDIVTVADTALFESPLSPPWYATFAGNAVVLAYRSETAGGRRIADAGPDRWYEPLLDGGVRLGRTDPDQDPLGYRTLFALELATAYYDAAPALAERIPRRNQVYPETTLISQFETGAIDAAFTYRNMAVERGYDYVSLPAAIDLSDPAHAERYATVSYTLPSGHEVDGGVIGYGSTVRTERDAALDVFTAHTTGAYLDDAGFVLDGTYPRYEGDVPNAVDRAAERTAANRRPRQLPSGGPETALPERDTDD